jgi:hypothetical protein
MPGALQAWGFEGLATGGYAYGACGPSKGTGTCRRTDSSYVHVEVVHLG